jgi:small subunit ribosomal protein S13
MFSYKQVQLANGKELRNSLQNIYGIGWHKSGLVSAKIGFCYPYLIDELNLYLFFLLSCVLDDLTWLQVRINREISQRIDSFVQMNCYKGIRHGANMPCRGQRTRTNASTRKRWRLKLI